MEISVAFGGEGEGERYERGTRERCREVEKRDQSEVSYVVFEGEGER